jgi:hypothetical protein
MILFSVSVNKWKADVFMNLFEFLIYCNKKRRTISYFSKLINFDWVTALIVGIRYFDRVRIKIHLQGLFILQFKCLLNSKKLYFRIDVKVCGQPEFFKLHSQLDEFNWVQVNFMTFKLMSKNWNLSMQMQCKFLKFNYLRNNFFLDTAMQYVDYIACISLIYWSTFEFGLDLHTFLHSKHF